MIGVKNICFSYGEKTILDNITLNFIQGKAFCIQGASGVGKSTILRILMGLEKPQSGEVFMPQKISVVFQEDRLLKSFNVMKNISIFTKATKEEINNMLERLGLSEIKNAKISALSGGMKRRIAFIRAILFKGDALILDEAFNGIDDDNKKIMVQIIKEEYLNKGKYVIMVSHNDTEAEMLGADIFYMNRS